MLRPSAGPAPLTPFVERDAERASLRRLVDDTLAGHGRLALVAGEPGVGKSRLVAEIGDEAEARGMRVLTGHCVEMSGAPPYLPYVEIIEQAINSPRSPLALREALGDVAPEIARIAPALRRVFPDIPPPVELPAELARRYVWNSFGEFIGRAAQRQPLLLVLEDLHWADESTVLLTEYLAPLLPEMPVLVLGTYRDVEVDLHIRWPASSASSRAAAWWNGSVCAGSRSTACGAMLRALAGQTAPEQLVQLIDRETEGNPFFVEEVYLHLVESGVLLDEHGGCALTCRWTRCRCRRASGWCWGNGWAAWPRRPARCWWRPPCPAGCSPPSWSARWPSADPDAAGRCLRRSRASQTHRAGKAAGELMFSHELIRQTLLADVSALKRERLHLQAADGDLAPLLRRPRGARRRAGLPPVPCRTLRGSGQPGSLPDDRR